MSLYNSKALSRLLYDTYRFRNRLKDAMWFHAWPGWPFAPNMNREDGFLVA
jgi:hypothetical protein